MNALIELVGELVDAIELREAAEPELRAFDADARVRSLERRLAAEYRLALPDDPVVTDMPVDRRPLVAAN